MLLATYPEKLFKWNNVRASASSSLAICIIVTEVLGLSVENPHRLVFTTEQYCIRAMYINLRFIMKSIILTICSILIPNTI